MFPVGGYWNGEIGERRRPLRFGPDLEMSAAQEMDAARQGEALGGLIRQTMERMRHPLWFWEVTNG